MQTTKVLNGSNAATSQPAKRGGNRKMIIGGCLAILCSTALVISAAGNSQELARLAVAGIEGNAIVEFDGTTPSTKQATFRVDCSAINGSAASVHTEATFTPVIVSGLAAGEKYDCRASMVADASTLNSVHVRVIGQ